MTLTKPHPRRRSRMGSSAGDATVDDHRIIQQFSDAELEAILRRRVGIVPVESDEERPEGEPLN